MKTMMVFTAAMTALAAGNEAMAQVRIQTAPRGFTYVLGDPDRPMIGVSTRSSGKRDTLGLLVESVTRAGPAEQAGIEEGDRLVSVNGVNLRLSPIDAGESDMEGIATRRLVRELGKVDAGAEVELQVYRDGASRSVRVKTVAAEDLNQSMFARSDAGILARRMTDRAVLGLSLGGSGSPRDTLGILVVGVNDSGPAAIGGIEEGDRVASINGVELRVAREDAGDSQASSARINRLNREMEKVKAGDAVELRVYAAGQYRTVRVEAARAEDLRGDGAYFFNDFGRILQGIRRFDSPRGAVRVIPRGSAGTSIRSRVQERNRESLLKEVEARLRSRAEMETRIRDTREALERRVVHRRVINW
jgi:predicted metalloprotease with PDZ domain